MPQNHSVELDNSFYSYWARKTVNILSANWQQAVKEQIKIILGSRLCVWHLRKRRPFLLFRCIWPSSHYKTPLTFLHFTFVLGRKQANAVTVLYITANGHLGQNTAAGASKMAFARSPLPLPPVISVVAPVWEGSERTRELHCLSSSLQLPFAFGSWIDGRFQVEKAGETFPSEWDNWQNLCHGLCTEISSSFYLFHKFYGTHVTAGQGLVQKSSGSYFCPVE